MSGDRCLARLEEVTLERETLLRTIEEKDKLIDELSKENNEYKRVNGAYETAMVRWEATNAD